MVEGMGCGDGDGFWGMYIPKLASFITTEICLIFPTKCSSADLFWARNQKHWTMQTKTFNSVALFQESVTEGGLFEEDEGEVVMDKEHEVVMEKEWEVVMEEGKWGTGWVMTVEVEVGGEKRFLLRWK